jgi:hypothetical protein
MDARYFSNLYTWLRRQEGFSIICEYLNTFEIPEEFGLLSLIDRAPLTSSTESAIEQGRGGIEQEVLEAIEEGKVGFRGGWVSSIALDNLLKHLRVERKIPMNKRRELMQSLDYDWHPGLKEGRVNNTIPLDGGKPRLYVKNGHKHTGLLGGGEITRTYIEAQQEVVDEL